ncbi:MAG: hypothetical protein AAFQ80_24830 [Cyanobacteria bacterium J06621_8]
MIFTISNRLIKVLTLGMAIAMGNATIANSTTTPQGNFDSYQLGDNQDHRIDAPISKTVQSAFPQGLVLRQNLQSFDNLIPPI